MNWDKVKFRPSMLDKILTSKGLSASEKARDALIEVFIQEKYNRRKEISSKYFTKGLEQEADSIRLYRQVTQTFAFKNETKFENDWVKGTPDLVLKDKVVDIKTAWDLWTFHKQTQKAVKENYYFQLLAYCWLTGKTKAEIAYCLPDMNSNLILEEIRKQSYGLSEGEIIELEEKIEHTYTYPDIPPVERVKIFEFEFTESDFESAKKGLEKAREFLKTL